MQRRILFLTLAIAALIPGAPAASAQTTGAKVVVYAGTCELRVTFHFNGPIGFGTLTNPGYTIEVQPVSGVMPCQLSDDPLNPLRNTEVTASGSSSLFDCDTAVASGGWSQSWTKGNGTYSPQPVSGGRHKVFGTWDNWVIETEGPSIATFAGALYLQLDPLWAAQNAVACSNGSLWELHMIGTQVFQDPQP
jgi:hypothetical protein